MTYSPKIVQQLGCPQGLLGRLVLNRLNAANVEMNKLTLQSLDVRQSDRLLEVGFGGGALLREIIDMGACNDIHATDLSALAVSRAKKIFKREIRADKLSLRECSERSLPYHDEEFTKVCCVNVIYFWPKVQVALREISRILQANGTFVLTYCEQSPDRQTDYTSNYVSSQLVRAGFSVASSARGSDKENGAYHCTVAIKT